MLKLSQKKKKRKSLDYFIAAGAGQTNCYERCALSMGRPTFRPTPTAPTFSTDLSKPQNQERYPGRDPACKMWLTSADEKSEFWRSFLSF